MEFQEKLEELEEKIEQVQRENKKLHSKNERLEKKVERLQQKERIETKQEKEDVSRRDFLKKLGAGMIGLGALSLPSASALNMRSNDFTFYGDDNTEEFQINDGGPVEVKNSNLRFSKDHSIEDSGGTSRIDFLEYRTRLNDNDGRAFISANNGGMTTHFAYSNQAIRIFDKESSSTAIQYNTGDPNGTLDLANANLRIDTGNTIEDDTGVQRLRVGSNSTFIGDEDNNNAIAASTTNNGLYFNTLGGMDGTVQISGENNEHFRVTSGGPVEVKNADLDFNSNNIKEINSIAHVSDGANASSIVLPWDSSTGDVGLLRWRNPDASNNLMSLDTSNFELWRVDLDLGSNDVKNVNNLNVSSMTSNNGSDAIDVTQSMSISQSNGSYALSLSGNLHTGGNTIDLDGGDQFITIHDGSGNYNFKSGVDSANNIVAGQGATHMRMNENGLFEVLIDSNTAEGNNFNSDSQIDFNENRFLIQNANMRVGGDIVADNGGIIIWDDSNSHIQANYIEQGSGSGLDADKVDGHNVFVQSSEPSNPDTNDIWIDTS